MRGGTRFQTTTKKKQLFFNHGLLWPRTLCYQFSLNGFYTMKNREQNFLFIFYFYFFFTLFTSYCCKVEIAREIRFFFFFVADGKRFILNHFTLKKKLVYFIKYKIFDPKFSYKNFI